MACSSSSCSSWNYDVFLSFRGTDTRNTFTGHLYRALRHKGVNVFIDNELMRGEVITSQLLRVIEESRISIILLSENYASSSFCLDELARILECRVSKGQTVIPVFYHVDPTDVEKQRGTFGQEFAKLEAHHNQHSSYWKRFPASFLRFILTNVSETWPIFDNSDGQRNKDEEATENMERVQKWKLALIEVARLSGWHLEKGDHESNIIQEIVKKVSRKLDYTPLHVAKHPVGLVSRVEYIVQKLNMESRDVCMLGLHGMGGVGKTTTAIALYNRYASQFEFEGSCFLSNVRENSKKHGLAELQQTLLSEILGDQEHLIKNSEKGIELIKRRLRSKKVLIVIDDVDHLKQLQQLAGGLEWFGGGSIIIITTRDLHLLEHHGATIIQEIKELKFDEALQLFSWHAFKESQPDEVDMEFSSRLIRYVEGLPLALIVLGSSLYKRSAPQWDDMLKKLKRCPNKEINDVLKVSYDSLDSEEKTIFLDIAFFFKGKHKDEVTKFLGVCGFGAHLGIQRLIEKSLVYVDFKGTLEMHDLLEVMGIKIAVEESSRLYIRERENIPRLFVGDKIAYNVEILVLDFYGEEKVPLNWLQNLTKLRALVILKGQFIEMPKKLQNSIKWFEWHNSCLTSIPPEFLPPNLLVLEMPCSNTNKFLADMSKAQKLLNLTHVNFRGSKHLREMVDFSSIPNLKVLDLSGCEKLEKIHKSVGRLKKLEELKLWGCYSLPILPSLVENQCLVSIVLRDCSKLENVPNLPTTITRLYLENSGITKIPSFIGNLINLHYIDASSCENLTCVSHSIYKLPSIETFYINKCRNLPQLPEAENSVVSSNSTRYELNVSRNKFVSLPINTFKFIQIKSLNLNNCEWLVEIPELPHTLCLLRARNCKSLLRFSQFQFDRFEGDFRNCHKITENEMQSWREMLQDLSLTRMEEEGPSREYSITFPGNEIPEWFSYVIECEGNKSSFKLSSPVSKDNLVGIAWCVLFQYPQSYLSFEVRFSMNDFTLGSHFLSPPLESEHMWLGFNSVYDLPKLLEVEEISCKFDCKNAVVFKRFGVHFIYKNQR